MLRDRLVCGVNEDRIQRRLLAEPTLDLKRALEIAQGMETTAKDARDMKPEITSKSQHIYKINYMVDRATNIKNVIAVAVNMTLQIAVSKQKNACRSSKAAKTHSRENGRQSKQKMKNGRGSQLNTIEQDKIDKELAYNLFKFKHESKSPRHRKNINVNGIDINMKIDTGASFSVINEKTYEEIRQGKEES